jgi:serine/threonine protein kinase/Tfp pilus assembly protein PilF
MGEIFVAEDPMLARKLAVKILPREFALDPERRSRLLHEARAASALNHPNIITVHDLGESDGVLFIAVELIEGDTLREWSVSSRRGLADILAVARQAARALVSAHAAGLVHRDLKPENLMIRRDGLLKILDFGLARSLTPGTAARTATMPGTVMGTAPYMSPEQVLGQTAGPPSDIFSLGTILYELLTGKHPFAVESQVETMHRILHETQELPSRLNPALSAEFDFVLGKALSKDPRRRHSSMSDFEVDLETLECGCDPTTGAKHQTVKNGPRTIAVLPFKNIGGDPELSYLGVGLADAVITRLAHSPDLIVRTTSSILPYQDQPVEPRRVAQELDVSAVLDASFQRIGERFRATARLVEGATGRPVWAGKVDVRFEDVFEVQDQVAHGIAEALMARLNPDAAEPKRAYTPNGAAYEHVLRGMEALRQGTREAMEFAVEQLEQAVQVDPQYVPAWANLAFVYNAMIDGGFSPDPLWQEKAGQALARAQALDPRDAQVHFVAGVLNLVRGKKREAYRELTSSLALLPHSNMTYHYLGYLYRLCDMLDEANAAEERAIELEPYTPWSYGSRIRQACISGRFDEARVWLDRERQKIASRRNAGFEALILYWEGRYAEAYDGMRRHLESGEELPGSLPDEIIALLAGKREEAEKRFEAGRGFAEIDMDGAVRAALYCAQTGDPDGAFRFLDRAAELGNDTLTHFERFALFEPLRTDRRWAPFIEGVRGRVAQWKREFRWPPAA